MNRQKNGFNGNPINSGSKQQAISIKQLKLKRGCLLQVDNDPKHISKSALDSLKRHIFN